MQSEKTYDSNFWAAGGKGVAWLMSGACDAGGVLTYRVHKTAVTMHMARCGSAKAEHIADP